MDLQPTPASKKRTKGMCTVLVNTLCAEIADAYFVGSTIILSLITNH